MTPEEQRIVDLGQSVSLARTSRYSDVEDDELVEFIDQTIDWANQYLSELELEADWNFVRQNHYEINSALAQGVATFSLPDDIQRLVMAPERDITITHDNAVVATFRLVSPNQIADPSNPYPRDRATVVGRNLILSRPITEDEVGGSLNADVVRYIPRISRDDVQALDLVEPTQLMVLGMAKNWSLGDIVQGGISPNLTQKYSDLLMKAIAKNNETAEAYDAMGEDFSWIGGLW